FLSVLKDEPNHAEALHMLGVVAWQRGNLVQAIEFLKRSLGGNNGSNGFTWKHLGDVYFLTRNLRAAVASYEQALRLRPDMAEAHNDMGNALQYLGEWPRAVQCHQEAIRLMPSLAQAYDSLGNALKAQGKRAEAWE